jgi:hypothetical protein
VFDQVIYWDWKSKLNRYDVRGWRLVKDGRLQQTDEEKKIVPPKDAQWVGSSLVPVAQPDGTYKAVFFDEHGLREVTCDVLQEEWVQQDTELLERAIKPKEERPDLTDIRFNTKAALEELRELANKENEDSKKDVFAP